MESDLKPARAALVLHWVYKLIDDLEALRVFMASHIFAVWDFMSLLKTLQKRLTCVESPWFPPEDPLSARLVNEIVLSEETDEIGLGTYMSHFELYLAAMQEVGADRQPIDHMLHGLRQGKTPQEAAKNLQVPQATRDFVCNTLEMTKLEPHEVAAAFLFGREGVIPGMFKELLSQPTIGSPISPATGEHIRRYWRRAKRFLGPRGLRVLEPTTGQGPGANAFRMYLERHIELDANDHEPMAAQLLMNLCGKDPQKWEEATAAAERALTARHKMWNAVAKVVVDGRKDGWTPARATPVIVLPSTRAASDH